MLRTKIGRAFSTTRTSLSKLEDGVWTQSENRSLKINNDKLRNELLNGVDAKKGPITVRRRINKIAYNSPEGLDDVFPLAYNFLQNEAEKSKKKLETETDPEAREKLLVETQKWNPQVLYKVQFGNPENLDLLEPVLQHYYKTKNFDNYNKMLLMQRVEQLHIIPDSIATIDPSAEFNVKFINESGVNKFITPGEILSSKTTAKPPLFQIKLFEKLSETDKYTILVVNLDVPDLVLNSFSTSLNYGLKNLSLNSNNQIIRSGEEIIEYVPPIPEKNAPTNRLTTLLCKQNGDLDVTVTERTFDLRQFLEVNSLTPVGINCWRSNWDSNVNSVCQAYGLPEGRVFHRVRR